MKRINDNAPVKSRHQIQISTDLNMVWELLTGIDKWPSWNSDISEAFLHGPLTSGTAFTWKSGASRICSEIHHFAKNKSFGWKGSFFGVKAIHYWSLEEKDGMVTVTTEESMEGFLAKLLAGMLQRKLDKSLLNWLDCMKSAL
ncbi:SRPBCC family protein [Pedobacter deserti]|uniref:SRPBCC family protein n=1 Tax=Pedobacter deserti TaxID=2817382 RepID=UPI00210CD08C|nr:SRPBCC family protein [Pedobacter sp. SYSU D00382]